MTQLDAALRYLELGYRPIPIASPELGAKCPPKGFKWRPFQKRTPTEAEVRKWWRRWPHASVAIICGAGSGVDVLDFDPRADPNWPGPNRELPTGLIVRTPRGGCHRYFAHVQGYKGQSHRFGEGIDTRTEGNYVIAPPTTRRDGQAYAIIHGDYETARETACPEWLQKELLADNGQKPTTAPAIEDEAIPRGKRNSTLTSLAGTLRRRGLNKSEILESLRAINRRCEPPLSEKDLRKIAKSIGNKKPAPKKFQLTDLGNAERFAAQQGGRVKFVPELGWLVFDGCAWRRDPAAAERLAKETTRSILADAAATKDDDQAKRLAKWALKTQSRNGIAAMLALAESEPEIDGHTELFDTDPWLLNVENGTLDLRDVELRSHNASDFLSKTAGTKFDANATCPVFQEFLQRIFDGNDDVIAFVQRAAGYTLSGDVGERCLFFCYGTGANGKSTLLETLIALLGEYARQADVETFLARNRAGGVPNDLARLAGARLVCAVETGEGRRLAEGLVKQMTGRDTVAARYLFREYFEFRPQFKLWLAANHKPTIRGTDNAIWDRIRLIPFTVTIPEAERDPGLPERLRSELPGILRWALQGALAWQRDEGLHAPDEVRAATMAYRGEMDILAKYLDERCTLANWATVSAREIYRAYTRWAEENGERVLTQTKFGLQLTERGFVKSRCGTGAIIYKGITLKNPEETQE